MNSTTSPGDLESLVKARPVGYSLEAPFYTSPECYDLDLEAVFARHWLFCATEAEIPEPGDFVTVDVGPYSVIVLRDDDEDVRALHNVCRHRGSRILDSPCGSVGNLVCPYHQWTYRTDGSLIFAEAQPPTFDKSRFGLKSVHVRTLAGLIFVCLAADAPADFDEVAAAIEPYLSPYSLATAKVAHQTDLVEEGNWKLVMENNRECQHCDAAHPELITAYFPLFGYSEDDITPRLRPVFERYRAAAPEPPVHLRSVGSNNWVVGARRSASGQPLFANDPHVPLLPLPTYWYHAHLEWPGVRVQGGCFPGYPAFGFGHNGHLAWGCTTGFRDAWDLLRVDRTPGDRTRYRAPGGTAAIRSHRTTRSGRFGRSVSLAWESCDHGVLYPGWTHDDGADLAVRYVPSDAGRYLAGYLALPAAQTVESHRAALPSINDGPFDFNHVYAHRDGWIGWELFGRLPRRAKDGLFVRDAHDPDAQWRGFLDFAEMPKRLDPPDGAIATANSIVDFAQIGPIATRVHFEPRHRQDRIERLLAERERHDVESFRAIQADVMADYAPPLRDALVALLARFDGEPSREGRALASLRDWDGRFDAGSAAAAIFFFTQRALNERVSLALFGPRVGRRYAASRRALPRLQQLLVDAGDPLRADVERAAGMPFAELAAAALRAGLDRVDAMAGSASQGAWGRIQRARLGTFLAELPYLGARLVALDAPFPGDDYTVNPSRSLDEGHRLRALVAATSRFVCDLARPDEAWFAHSSGPSGDPGSAWHANLSGAWSRFELFRSDLWKADAVPDPVERIVLAGAATR